MDRGLIIILILAVLFLAGVPKAKLKIVQEKLDEGASAEAILDYLTT